MKVGISLLTLVPGVVGGSETYARELTLALARVGELEYEAFLGFFAQRGMPADLRERISADLRAVGAEEDFASSFHPIGMRLRLTSPAELEKIVAPEPVVRVAIEPKRSEDRQKFGIALGRMVAADPSLRHGSP